MTGSWKEALIIPIVKPRKDLTKTTGYKPVALISHLGKVMERMAVDRLMYVTERSNPKEGFSPFQEEEHHAPSSLLRIRDKESSGK